MKWTRNPYFATNVRCLRDRKKLTQPGLAALVGITRLVIWEYENGVSEPRLMFLVRIAAALEVSIDDLLTKDLTKKNADPHSTPILHTS